MTHRISFLLILALCACTDTSVDGCRCEGALPEGSANIACGESVCFGGGIGYTCTGANEAVRDDMACTARPDTGFDPDGGTDAGTIDSGVDSGMLDSGGRDTGPGVDAACTPTRHFADSDRDGFGDPDSPSDVCPGTDGFVLESTDCDDGNPSAHPGAVETCDGVDTDCVGGADPGTCAALAGTYTGSYEMRTEERIGSSVINAVHCLGGSFTVTVDLSASEVLQGTASCTYSGSLSGFDRNQSATLTGSVDPDGRIRGRLVHEFGGFGGARDGSFSFDGTISGGDLRIEDTGSYRPNSMSVVAWTTEYALLP